MKDPYATLGVSKTANSAEIKRAFRKKSKLAHPDREGGDVAVQSEINVAYKLLSSPERRAHWDRTGQDAPIPQADQVARQEILQMVQHAFMHLPEDEDLIAHVKGNLVAKKASLAQSRLIVTANRAKIKKRMGRLKGPPDNFLSHALQVMIDQADASIAKHNQDDQTLDLAVKILKDFSYEVPATGRLFLPPGLSLGFAHFSVES